MFEEYKTLVLNFYLEMKEKGFLSSDMENPGREKLKHECLIKFSKKNSKKDKDLIQMFFDPKNEYNDDHIRSIEKYDLDKFRPLVGFLISGKGVRDDKNVKLLAWLLDCPSYEDWRNGVVFPPVGPTSGTRPTGGGTIVYPPPSEPTSSIFFNIILSILLFFIISAAYVFWKKNKDKAIREADPAEQCMYWTGLHYEPTTCNEWGADKLKIPLNKEQLANQQKITLPDTLTDQSLGKVWYGKINSKPEFYTDSGMNPQDTTKRLLPLTEYMLHKYVSYDRYRLEVLVWSVSLLALFGVLVGMAYRCRPKKY